MKYTVRITSTTEIEVEALDMAAAVSIANGRLLYAMGNMEGFMESEYVSHSTVSK